MEGAAMQEQARDVNHLVDVVREEYLEMPGLRLTPPQVKRLWGLDEPTCNLVLHTLEEDHFLRRTARNDYVRADLAR